MEYDLAENYYEKDDFLKVFYEIYDKETVSAVYHKIFQFFDYNLCLYSFYDEFELDFALEIENRKESKELFYKTIYS